MIDIQARAGMQTTQLNKASEFLKHPNIFDPFIDINNI